MLYFRDCAQCGCAGELPLFQAQAWDRSGRTDCSKAAVASPAFQSSVWLSPRRQWGPRRWARAVQAQWLPGAPLSVARLATCLGCRSCFAVTARRASSPRTAPRCTPWLGVATGVAWPRGPSTRRPAFSCWKRTGW